MASSQTRLPTKAAPSNTRPQPHRQLRATHRHHPHPLHNDHATRNRFLCGIVIVFLLEGLWSNQTRATEPNNASPAMAPWPPGLNEKDLLPYKQKGRGTLAGQAFLSSPSEKAITQAGALVRLIPITPYTRHWFNDAIRITSCSATGAPTSPESASAPRTPTDCPQEALTRLQMEKRLVPYLRTTRANPTGHFWFTKIPAGRYYIVSLIDLGSEAHQDKRRAGLAWLALEIDVGEKLTTLVVTDCKANLC
jgi:hypothetical protein